MTKRLIAIPKFANPRLDSPLKYPGGKTYSREWIIQSMPSHLHFNELFFGGGSVLFAMNPQGKSELINDLDDWLTGFFATLQSPELFGEFNQRVSVPAVHEAHWRKCRDLLASGHGSPVERAVAFYTWVRQSRAGEMKEFTGITRNRLRGNRNAEVNAWLGAVDGLPAIHARLQNVVISNRPAIDCLRQLDGKRVLHYLDPPYSPDVRTNLDRYRKEMTLEDHRTLLHAAVECEGKVMISGYRSPLYDAMLVQRAGWRRLEREIANHAAGGKVKRRMTECLYVNY